MKLLTALISTFILSACAATGVKVTDDQLSQFHEGQTTKQEVIAALGQPTTTMRNADGTTMVMYTYSEARTRASTFIPIVGAFAGGVDSRASTAVLTFDQNGVLKSTSTSASQYGTATGIAVDGGAPVTDQPRKP
ncbi:outer membrane protein assembly factor BamE domain-containing protein [Castellaniella sp.]|uniref:outer membrane protein assembly factor BamE domain-containing protein n=1 Tax=Castellaniella sp. TaxID=1955812 RepID=UPI002AFF530E|nr:outer membrane protein assembly factor BamE [Castellaniella sp.]